MKNPKQKLVKNLNVATHRVTLIPASELAPGMAQVQLGVTGEIVWMPLQAIEENKDAFLHPPFEGELKEAIEFVQNSLRSVYPKTYGEWESGFRRDANPGQQIGNWVHLADTFINFVEENKPSTAAAEEAFKLLVACSISTPDTVFEIFRPRLLTQAVAQKLADAFFNPVE